MGLVERQVSSVHGANASRKPRDFHLPSINLFPQKRPHNNSLTTMQKIIAASPSLITNVRIVLLMLLLKTENVPVPRQKKGNFMLWLPVSKLIQSLTKL